MNRSGENFLTRDMRVSIAIGVSVVFILNGCGDSTPSKQGTGSNYNKPSTTRGPNGSYSSGGLPAPPVKLIKPSGSVCGPTTGNNLGLYTWGHEVWRDSPSSLIEFVQNPKVSEYGCGEVYINVSDYTAPHWIPDPHNLYPFIRNIRATGNRAMVYLVYGDVNVSGNGAPDGPKIFADTFFAWVATLSDSQLNDILPIGISYDCEHLAPKTIQDALNRCQTLKEGIRVSRLGGDGSRMSVQWTIEGERKPVDTDIVMKLADSALMMGYRNHVGTSIHDPEGEDNIVTRLMNFMFKEQCTHCLDDAYAAANYKAKIKLMFEADCDCGASCRKISFCAYDGSQSGWGTEYANGAEYTMATLAESERQLRIQLGPDRFNRLFGPQTNMSLFVIHNWQWFTCFFDQPSISVTTPIGKKSLTCQQYRSLAAGCRSK